MLQATTGINLTIENLNKRLDTKIMQTVGFLLYQVQNKANIILGVRRQNSG